QPAHLRLSELISVFGQGNLCFDTPIRVVAHRPANGDQIDQSLSDKAICGMWIGDAACDDDGYSRRRAYCCRHWHKVPLTATVPVRWLRSTQTARNIQKINPRSR